MATNKDRYEYLKAQGICTRCGKAKISIGRMRDKTTMCKSCLKVKNLTCRKLREKKEPHLKAVREKREATALRIQKELEKM